MYINSIFRYYVPPLVICGSGGDFSTSGPCKEVVEYIAKFFFTVNCSEYGTSKACKFCLSEKKLLDRKVSLRSQVCKNPECPHMTEVTVRDPVTGKKTGMVWKNAAVHR
jgi:hypothetical protein